MLWSGTQDRLPCACTLLKLQRCVDLGLEWLWQTMHKKDLWKEREPRQGSQRESEMKENMWPLREWDPQFLNFHSWPQFTEDLLFSISCSWDFARFMYSQVNLLLPGASLSGFLFLVERRIFYYYLFFRLNRINCHSVIYQQIVRTY